MTIDNLLYDKYSILAKHQIDISITTLSCYAANAQCIITALTNITLPLENNVYVIS